MSAVVQTEAAGAPEVSFVIPCLNEEEGVGAVVEGARERLAAAGASAEVIVVDNGSEDRSVERAEAAGARVVHESRRGYGSAYLAGMAAARGDYVFMADADGTYDLERVPEMLERLRNGAELVMGSRFKGGIERGAMPWTNRYIGNPILTGMLNLFFRTGVSDAHCGLRAIRRDAIPRLKLSATGMEFASEMVIKAAKRRLRIEEVPIRYRPRIGDSKLNRFRDAWRHVRFMLVHSPTWLFVIPGGLAAVAGLGTAAVLAFSGGDGAAPTAIALAAGILALLGAQLVLLGVYARTYAVVYLGEEEPALVGAWRRFRLEHGLGLGAIVAVVGLAVALVSHFNARSDPRLGFLGLTLLALGVQGIFGAFFLSILGLSEHAVLRRRPQR